MLRMLGKIVLGEHCLVSLKAIATRLHALVEYLFILFSLTKTS